MLAAFAGSCAEQQAAPVPVLTAKAHLRELRALVHEPHAASRGEANRTVERMLPLPWERWCPDELETSLGSGPGWWYDPIDPGMGAGRIEIGPCQPPPDASGW